MHILKDNYNVENIYHLADIHIPKTNARDDEYTSVFEHLYSTINGENSVIVLCGDVVDYKTSVSHYGIHKTITFLERLSNIAPVVMIPGNHDVNPNDLQELTTIELASWFINKNMKEPIVHHLKNPGVYLFGNVAFSVVSMAEKKVGLARDLPADKIKVALYHGRVDGANEKGKGEHLTCGNFKGYDYVMLGDYHEHQLMGRRRNIAYSSSLVQQNFGEPIGGHGYIKWNMVDKTAEFIEIPNNYGFVTLQYSSENGLQGYYPQAIPMYPRFRIFINVNDINERSKKIVSRLEKKHNASVRVITTQNAENLLDNVTDKNIDGLITSENSAYLNEKIVKYCRKTRISDHVESIINLNNLFMSKIQNNKYPRLPQWKLLYVNFDNMFNYGQGNHINFSEMNGNIGIFSKNTSGKSNIINIVWYLLYQKCLFNVMQKDICNRDASYFVGRVIFESNGKKFKVTRWCDVDKKEIVQTKLEYCREDGTWINSTKDKLVDTNNRIKSLLPKRSVALMTHVMFLGNPSEFTELSVSETNAFFNYVLRLSLLSELKQHCDKRIIGLKQESIVLETEIAHLSSNGNITNIDEHITLQQTLLEANNDSLMEYKNEISELHQNLKGLQNRKVTESRDKILENISHIKQQINDNTESISEFSYADRMDELCDINEEITNINKQIAALEESLKDFYDHDPSHVMEQILMEIDNVNDHLDTLHNITEANYKCITLEFCVNIRQHYMQTVINSEREVCYAQQRLHDCSDFMFNEDCDACQSNPINREIKAHENNIIVLTKKITKLHKKIHALGEYIDELNRCVLDLPHADDVCASYHNSMDSLMKLGQCSTGGEESGGRLWKRQLLKACEHRQSLVDKKDNMKRSIRQLSQLKETLAEYEKDLQALTDKQTYSQLCELRDEEINIVRNSANIKHQINELVALKNRNTANIELINNKRDQLGKCYSEINVHNMYSNMMNAKGLSTLIIQDILAPLEVTVNQTLSCISDFSVEMEFMNDRLCIQKVREGKTIPITNCSGFEKFIINLAFRFAFIKQGVISADFMVIDECFGCVDRDNRRNLNKVLDFFQNNLRFVLVISHESWLKDEDCCDDELIITQNGLISKVMYGEMIPG